MPKGTSRISKKLAEFPRLHNSLVPTPLQRLDGLCRRYGVEVWCKRDDLTGFAFGGNKTRKLDFLIPQALENNCDTLIAIGAAQSNFCRMAAGYAAAGGLETRLVLGGVDGEKPTGNLRLDYLLGARADFVNSPDWDDWAEAATKLEEELADQGKRVFRLPVGGSTPIGALGYAAALEEIARDEQREGLAFQTIIHASSSAGTQAGLVVGQALSGHRARVLGISVAKPREILEREVTELARATASLLGEPELALPRVTADDSQLGTAYGDRTREGEAAVRFFAREYGIFLDYVYSGKAAAALLARLENGEFGRDEAVLFIHTGGNIELFA